MHYLDTLSDQISLIRTFSTRMFIIWKIQEKCSDLDISASDPFPEICQADIYNIGDR